MSRQHTLRHYIAARKRESLSLLLLLFLSTGATEKRGEACVCFNNVRKQALLREHVEFIHSS